MPPRCTAERFSAILKLTPCYVFIEDIWEGQNLLTDNVVHKLESFNLLFPNIVKKQFFKRKTERRNSTNRDLPKKGTL